MDVSQYQYQPELEGGLGEYNRFNPQAIWGTMNAERTLHEPTVAEHPTPSPAYMEHAEDASNLSLADIYVPRPSSSSPTRPSEMIYSANRTETDLRRVVAERIARLNDPEDTRATYMLPECQRTTPNQAAMFIRRLRDRFYPEGALSQRESRECIAKPHMPEHLGVALFATEARGNVHSFRYQEPLPAVSNTDDKESVGLDSTDESIYLSGSEFTDDEDRDEPGEPPKGRYITRDCSEFRFYEMRRQYWEAKDLVRAEIEASKRQLELLAASQSHMKVNHKRCSGEKRIKEEDDENVPPEGSAHEEPERESSRGVEEFTAEIRALHNDSDRELDQRRVLYYRRKFQFSGELSSCTEALVQYSTKRALEPQTFESRRRLRKCMRAGVVARKWNEYVPLKYTIVGKHPSWWREISKEKRKKRDPNARTRCRRYENGTTGVTGDSLNDESMDAFEGTPRKFSRRVNPMLIMQFWERIEWNVLEPEVELEFPTVVEISSKALQNVPYWFDIDSTEINALCDDDCVHTEMMQERALKKKCPLSFMKPKPLRSQISLPSESERHEEPEVMEEEL